MCGLAREEAVWLPRCCVMDSVLAEVWGGETAECLVEADHFSWRSCLMTSCHHRTIIPGIPIIW